MAVTTNTSRAEIALSETTGLVPSVVCFVPGEAPPDHTEPAGTAGLIEIQGDLGQRQYDEIAAWVGRVLDSGAPIAGAIIASGGGALAGLDGAMQALAQLRSLPRGFSVLARAAGSAAYGLAATATPGQLFAVRGGLVGSLGAKMQIDDTSRVLQELGVTRHAIVGSRVLKNTSAPGVPQTEEILEHAEVQRSSADAAYMAMVAAARGVDVATLETQSGGRGGFFDADLALGLGLVDGIMTVHEFQAHLEETDMNFFRNTAQPQAPQQVQPGTAGYVAPAAQAHPQAPAQPPPQQVAQQPAASWQQQPLQHPQPASPPPPQQVAASSETDQEDASRWRQVLAYMGLGGSQARAEAPQQPVAPSAGTARLEQMVAQTTAAVADIAAAVQGLVGHQANTQAEAAWGELHYQLFQGTNNQALAEQTWHSAWASGNLEVARALVDQHLQMTAAIAAPVDHYLTVPTVAPAAQGPVAAQMAPPAPASPWVNGTAAVAAPPVAPAPTTTVALREFAPSHSADWKGNVVVADPGAAQMAASIFGPIKDSPEQVLATAKNLFDMGTQQ